MQNYTSCNSHRNLATDQLCKLCKVCWIEEVFLRSSIFNLQSSKLCKFWMQRSRPNEAWKVTSDTKP